MQDDVQTTDPIDISLNQLELNEVSATYLLLLAVCTVTVTSIQPDRFISLSHLSTAASFASFRTSHNLCRSFFTLLVAFFAPCTNILTYLQEI